MNEEEIIKERTKKVIDFFKKKSIVFPAILLLILIIFGAHIRFLPLTDHGGKPGLWDFTKNDYTLGPDLDPYLFLRYAQNIIETGNLPVQDNMRYYPLGFDTTTELQMVSYMIVITYKLLNFFGNYSLNYAGAFMPVLMFVLTIISYFFFVRELFIKKDEGKNNLKSNLIAGIATFFMIIMPGFLSRTIAGIPEKESVGFFFMFLALFLFLKSWKSEKINSSVLLAVSAGITTALMGLTWGGVIYLYTVIPLAVLGAFLVEKIKLKETISYTIWIVFTLLITLLFTNRFSLIDFVTSLSSGLSCLVLIIIWADRLLWHSKIKDKLNILLEKNIPKPIITLIFSLLISILLISITLGPNFIINKITDLNRIFFTPIEGRWVETVAENRQPYFTEWANELGPKLGKFSVTLWLFIIGSIVLFGEMLKNVEKKERLKLIFFYILFFTGLAFSRYAAHPHFFDGENFLSKTMYYLSGFLLILSLGYYQYKHYKNSERSLSNINFDSILLFSLLVLGLFTARSAIRLVMVLVVISPIFFSYLIIKLGFSIKEESNRDKKFIKIVLFTLVLVLLIFSGFKFYSSIKVQSYYNVPYQYTFQWQNAMDWVRENTPPNAVFSHWWDYGYWVQSIGERATVTDGGNVYAFWNYLTGRLVLTGESENDTLEFLYTHNVTHVLIDPTDISKYGAFSQIGSNENYDRLSSGPIILISEKRNIQETKNWTIRFYNSPSGNSMNLFGIEEEINYLNEKKENIRLFRENSAFAGINIKYLEKNSSIEFGQPEALFVTSGNKQVILPVRYLYYGGKIMDFKIGINATAYPIPSINDELNSVDNLGAMIYLSPRIMRGLLGQVYILNNALGNFKSLNLVHEEQDYITSFINQKGFSFEGFYYYFGGRSQNGLKAPIKIWEVRYKGNEKINPEYLSTTLPKYITWRF
jgi:asparagine N-glycosylation enzyme membrane subunit Stt3